jgi:hypothetical protein
MNLRSLVLIGAAMLGLAAGSASAQSNGDYQTRTGVTTANWNGTNVWQQYQSGSWADVTTSPTSADGVITVRSGAILGITADVTVDQVVVASGATVDVNTNNRTLTIANGSGIDMDVSGVLKMTNNGAAISVAAGAELKFENGGLYQHGQNAGSVPTATWADGSTCEINGNGTNANPIMNLGQSFYDLKWNMTGGGGGGSKNAVDLVTVRNDFTILQISGTVLQLAVIEADERTINIGGDLIVSLPGYTVTVNQGPADMTINVGGDYIHDGAGLFQLSGGNGTGTMNLSGDFVHTAGEFTEQVPDQCWLRFVGTTDQTASTYDIEKMTNSINVEINKSGGRLLLGSNLRVNGTAILRMTAGNVLTYSDTLMLGQSATSRGTLEWTSGTIVGNFRRWFASSTVSNVLFPIGTEIWHRPASLSFTAAPSAGGSVTGSFHDTDPGTYGLPLNENGDTYNTVCSDGFWTLTAANGLLGGTYSLDLTATGFGCVTDPSTIAILKRADELSAWGLNGTDVSGTGTVTDPIAHRTGMQGFSNFGITSGGDDTPLPIELAEFVATSRNGEVDLRWRTGAEVNNEGFEVQRATETDEEFQTIASYRTHSELIGLGTSYVGKQYGFTDDGSFGLLVTGSTYRYRLVDVGLDGSRTVHQERSVRIEGRTSSTQGLARLTLGAVAPNPVVDRLAVSVIIAAPTTVTLEVYSADGRVVAIPVDHAEYAEGTYAMTIDTRELRPGAYALRLFTVDGVRSQRFLVVR